MIDRIHELPIVRPCQILERALGRKALEADELKKAFDLKGLTWPEGT